MMRFAYFALAVLAITSPDVSQVSHWRSEQSSGGQVFVGASLPALPATDQDSNSSKKAERLQPPSELAIVRYVDGEFARAVRPLPSVKSGVHIWVGKPMDEQALRQEVTRSILAASPGDTVQITQIQFKPTEIRVDINGGSHQHKSWRDRIHIEVGGPLPQTRVINQNQSPGIQQIGTTLILDFGGPVPDLTPDQVKQYLSGFLDFSKQRSPAVNWVETLPPEFQKAITDKRAVVGMSHEMVLAALGQPWHKVRERNSEGVETEDWIYGYPPEKTIFVTFVGDKVIRVEQFQ